LILAVFVWFIIEFVLLWNGWNGVQPVDHPFSDLRSDFYTNQPVLVLTRPEDKRAFELDPNQVDFEVRGRRRILNRLAPKDIKLFVNLADMPDISGAIREVQYSAPRDLEIKVRTPNVIVERISSPEQSITNILTNILTNKP
jgi:hypothetical protein